MSQLPTPISPTVNTFLEASLERYKMGIIDDAQDDTRDGIDVPRTEKQLEALRQAFAERGFK